MTRYQLQQGHISGMVSRLSPGHMRVHLPGAVDPAVTDPIIGGRSSDGRWKVLAYLTLTDDGQFLISRLEVMPWEPVALDLNMQDLKALPLTRWRAEAHRQIIGMTKDHHEGTTKTNLKNEARILLDSSLPRAGDRGFGDAFYERLARLYLDLQGARGIQKRLATRLGELEGRPFSARQVSDATKKATKLGYLLPGTNGRGLRSPGPNLVIETRGK